MNDQVIISLASAIEANAVALQKLIDAIPVEVRQRVAEEVKVTPPKKAAQAQVEVAQPVVATAPVAPQAVVTETPKVEAAPASAPVVESGVVKAPFTTPKGLTDYLMDSYKAIPHKAKELEALVHSLGYRAVNEIKPESYDAIYVGVEALK